MGQRLVITVYDGKTEERVANVYQHWSAYTDSAAANTLVMLELMNEMLKQFPEANAKRIALEAMLRSNSRINITYDGYWQKFCEDNNLHNGNNIPENLRGPICKNFYYYLQNNIGLSEEALKLIEDRMAEDGAFTYDRNYGLIGIFDKDMDDTQAWSEGDVEITIDTEHHEAYASYFGVNAVYDQFEYEENYGDLDDADKYEIEADESKDQKSYQYYRDVFMPENYAYSEDEFRTFTEEVEKLNNIRKYNIKFIDKEGHIEYYSLVE